jgi:Endonuclease/Exonuclease/phosphatase family
MELLRFAWWNTRLAREAGDNQRQVAREVVKRLVDREGVWLLALGEVNEKDAEELRQACETSGLDLLAGDSVPRNLALVYRRDGLDLKRHEAMISMWGKKNLEHCLHVVFTERDGGCRFHLFVVHWPSNYMDNAASDERRTLAHDLCTEIRSIADSEHVVILGDFNVEPFDAAFRGLQASRARESVREGRARLYNPFWRLLGERQHLQAALESPRDRKGAGTYWYRGSNDMTKWYTYDQFLVSASLLDPKGWHLSEDATAIWQEPPLINENTGRPRYKFDHFPIVGTLRPPAPSSVQEGS